MRKEGHTDEFRSGKAGQREQNGGILHGEVRCLRRTVLVEDWPLQGTENRNNPSLRWEEASLMAFYISITIQSPSPPI